MVGADHKSQLIVANDDSSCYDVSSERGDSFMSDDAVIEILKIIQSSIVALDNRVVALDNRVVALHERVAALDEKFTRQYTILAQDVRMIRAGIHDMVKTRVTVGEVDALHEDMTRMELGLADLVVRMNALEHPRKSEHPRE
jgi:hypothetical protein